MHGSGAALMAEQATRQEAKTCAKSGAGLKAPPLLKQCHKQGVSADPAHLNPPACPHQRLRQEASKR